MSTYHNSITKKVLEFISKRAHEVRITLARCPSLQHWKGITTK